MPGRINGWDQGLGWFARRACLKIARRFDIDPAIGWIKAAERACSALTAKDVDIILTTGPPFAPFRLAKHLSDRLGRPYVLDYRDPWTGNPYADHPDWQATIQEEARLLSGCAAATVVSPSWALSLQNRFNLGSKLRVLTNGFDPEELKDVEPYNFSHFAIVYAGNFYLPKKRTISPLMAALRHLKETINDKLGEWYFHYYGGYEDYVLQEAKRFDVIERVVPHGRVQRSEALSAVRGAGVAVVITSDEEEGTTENKGIVPGKVFEALGLKTPILLIAPTESDARAVTEGTGLAQSFTGGDIDGIASFLKNMMLGEYVPKPKNLELYSWTNIAKRLSSVLLEAAGMVSQRK
jgi:glycosyltransferase involved in cell wall biosynthesis